MAYHSYGIGCPFYNYFDNQSNLTNEIRMEPRNNNMINRAGKSGLDVEPTGLLYIPDDHNV